MIPQVLPMLTEIKPLTAAMVLCEAGGCEAEARYTIRHERLTGPRERSITAYCVEHAQETATVRTILVAPGQARGKPRCSSIKKFID